MTKKPEPIDNLNVVPGCILQCINEATLRWDTLGEIAYTPKAINDYLKESKRDNVWVLFLGGRELWWRTEGRLAEKAKGSR